MYNSKAAPTPNWRGSKNYAQAARTAFKALKDSFPNSNLPDESASQFLGDFEDMASEFGCDRFMRAVEHARRWEIDERSGAERPRKFFPNPNEIRGFIPPKDTLPEVAERGCLKCNFTTWRESSFDKRAVRCECFEQYKRQLEAGCRKPPALHPLTLPEVLAVMKKNGVEVEKLFGRVQ